jgi:SHS2 domain-containing protein
MYEWVEHTAELELRLEAETLEGLFRDGLAAFSELLGEDPVGEPVQHPVSASGPDPPTLLAEWLNELVFLAETEGFVPEAAERLEVTADTVDALVRGRRGSPPPLVKAVTYHRLTAERRNGVWTATVVLDV